MHREVMETDTWQLALSLWSQDAKQELNAGAQRFRQFRTPAHWTTTLTFRAGRNVLIGGPEVCLHDKLNPSRADNHHVHQSFYTRAGAWLGYCSTIGSLGRYFAF